MKHIENSMCIYRSYMVRIWLKIGVKVMIQFMDLKCEDAVYNLETVYVHMWMDSDNNFQVTKPVSNG